MTEAMIERRRRQRAENIAINSKKTPKSKCLIFAREHKGLIEIVDPELRAELGL